MMYEEHVLEFYGNPVGKVPHVEGFEFTGTSEVASCGDKISIGFNLGVDNRVSEMGWCGHGCCFTEAAASMLVKDLLGRSFKRLTLFDSIDLLLLFRAKVTSSRMACVLLPYNSLKKAMETVNDHTED